MVGIVGGAVTPAERDAMAAAQTHEDRDELVGVSAGEFELGAVTHGGVDPACWRTVETGEIVGVLYGGPAPVEEGEFAALVADVLAAPASALSDLDGSFALACADADEAVVATDRMASWPWYYATDRAAFATSVAGVIPVVEDPSLDARAVGDLFAADAVWGERTLAEEVRRLDPASYLRFRDDDVEKRRYWTPTIDVPGPGGYVDRLLGAYREGVAGACKGLNDREGAGRVATWLSGGLDSRSMVTVLSGLLDSFVTITYDANPGGGANTALAKRVADTLGVPNEGIRFTPGEFAGGIREGVRRTDGTTAWRHYHNVPVFENYADDVGVVVRSDAQGELFGEFPRAWQLDGTSPPVEAITDVYARWNDAVTDSVLTVEADFDASVREEVARSPGSSGPETVAETLYRNHNPNFHYRNRITRSYVGVRIPFADADLVEAVVNLPAELHRGHAPLSFGRVPDSTAPAKLRLVRKLDRGVEAIPYQRSGVKPTRPLLVHTLWHGLKVLRSRIRGEWGMYARWLAEEPPLRDRVEGWLDAAKDRDVFDAGGIESVWRTHLQGEANRLHYLAVLTTVELWMQEFLD